MSNIKRHIYPGDIFRNWTVIKQCENKNRKRFFLCKCACGNEHIISLYTLAKSTAHSCEKCRIHHGKGKSNFWKITHGGTRNIHKNQTSSEYISWSSMKHRCLNPKHDNYHLYGGKGVSIYPDWVNDFSKFLEYMGPKPTSKHTIDRIDLNGNYEPGNVRWATLVEQNTNRSNTLRIIINGEILYLRDYCQKNDIDYVRVVNAARNNNISFNEVLEYVKKVPLGILQYMSWKNLDRNLSDNPVDLSIQCECGHYNNEHSCGDVTNIGGCCIKCDCQKYKYSAKQIRRLQEMKKKITDFSFDKT